MQVLVQTVGAGYRAARDSFRLGDHLPHIRIGNRGSALLTAPTAELFGDRPFWYDRLGVIGPAGDGTFVLPILEDFDGGGILALGRRRTPRPLAAASLAAYQVPRFEALTCAIWLTREPAWFSLSGLGQDDTLLLTIFAMQRMVATVQHAEEPDACWAECANGETGQPCVECEQGGVGIRVCC